MTITLPNELVPLAQKVGVLFPPIDEDKLRNHHEIWHKAIDATYISGDLNSWWFDNYEYDHYYAQPPKNSGKAMDALHSFWTDRLASHVGTIEDGATSMAITSGDFAAFVGELKNSIIDTLYKLKNAPEVKAGHWYWPHWVPAEDSPDAINMCRETIAQLEATFLEYTRATNKWATDAIKSFNEVTTQLKDELPKLSAG